MRVALDATPLLGLPTGVGAFCQGALAALAARPGVDVRAYAVSWRRRRLIEAARCPTGVTARQRPMPARPLHALWARGDAPPLEWFIGAADVVHGTNFVVPPTRRAAAVVSVHDLTPLHHPELCNEATLAYPGLIRRALGRGAWVHTDSAFVADEVIEAFGADPARVRVVNPGIPELPTVPARPRLRPRRAGCSPPGTGRFCLAVGTAEPRKDLPGLVRAFGAVAPRHGDVALVLAGPPGWGEESARRRHRRVAGPRADRPHGMGRAARSGRPPGAGHASWPTRRSTRGSASRRCRPCGPACRWWPRVPARCPRSSATQRSWSIRATMTGWSRRWTRASRTTRLRARLRRGGRRLVRPLLLGALRRRPRGALPRRRGRCRWLRAPRPRCSWRSSSSAGGCPAASAPTPGACSAAWPWPLRATRSTSRFWPAGLRAAPGRRTTRWPPSAGRCGPRGCRARS